MSYYHSIPRPNVSRGFLPTHFKSLLDYYYAFPDSLVVAMLLAIDYFSLPASIQLPRHSWSLPRQLNRNASPDPDRNYSYREGRIQLVPQQNKVLKDCFFLSLICLRHQQSQAVTHCRWIRKLLAHILHVPFHAYTSSLHSTGSDQIVSDPWKKKKNSHLVDVNTMRLGWFHPLQRNSFSLIFLHLMCPGSSLPSSDPGLSRAQLGTPLSPSHCITRPNQNKSFILQYKQLKGHAPTVAKHTIIYHRSTFK